MAFFAATPPNPNANTTAAGQALYPNQDTLGPGEWGYNDPNAVSKINQDWYADQKKKAPQQSFGANVPLFGSGGGFGAASSALGF